jgi:omega-amidase
MLEDVRITLYLAPLNAARMAQRAIPTNWWSHHAFQLSRSSPLRTILSQMKIVGLQIDISWENKPANFENVRRLLNQAAPEKNSLVVLPEMFATGFSMNVATVAEPYGGETEQFLSEMAKKHAIYLVGGAAMQSNQGRPRNKALVFGPKGELLGFYAKMRPFSPGGETEHYAAGDRPMAFHWNECTFAPFVCYDLRFPELFRQAAAAHRPELFVVIANWPEKRITHWVRLLQARAIENQAYVIGVNRVGKDPFYSYTGRSLILDYNGEILADAGQGEGSLEGRLDLDSLTKYRQGLPFLEDLVT